MTHRISLVTVVADTGKAILVESDEIEDEVDGEYGRAWVPQTQVHADSEVWGEGDEGALIVTDWFAKKRGWSK